MIEKQQAYRVGEYVFPTLQQAQIEALSQVLRGLDDGAVSMNAKSAAEIIVNNADKVKDILGVRHRKPRVTTATKSKKKNAAAVNAALQDMKQ